MSTDETIGERIRRETSEAITASVQWRAALKAENDGAIERAERTARRAAVAACERARWTR